jgi:glycosyltransferase involved in cell wall biosynthesis
LNSGHLLARKDASSGGKRAQSKRSAGKRAAVIPPDYVSEVSATVIAFNEEDDLEECLRSLTWCHEIILVDSGSQDRTGEIAARYGAKIFVRPFEGFSSQKNFAAEQATGDWILSVDADEAVSPELREEICQRLASETRLAGFAIPRRNMWLGTAIHHGGWYPDHTVRLYRRGAGSWQGHSHEQVVVTGAAGVLRHDLIHKSLRDIHDHLRKGLLSSVLELKEAKSRPLRLCWFFPFAVLRDCLRDFWAGPKTMLALRLIYKSRVKNKVDLVWLIPFYPFLRFFYMYVLRLGFLDGREGFWLAYTSAIVDAMKYLKIWEHFVRQRGKATARQAALEDTTKLYRSASQ